MKHMEENRSIKFFSLLMMLFICICVVLYNGYIRKKERRREKKYNIKLVIYAFVCWMYKRNIKNMENRRPYIIQLVVNNVLTTMSWLRPLKCYWILANINSSEIARLRRHSWLSFHLYRSRHRSCVEVVVYCCEKRRERVFEYLMKITDELSKHFCEIKNETHQLPYL